MQNINRKFGMMNGLLLSIIWEAKTFLLQKHYKVLKVLQQTDEIGNAQMYMRWVKLRDSDLDFVFLFITEQEFETCIQTTI